MAGGDFLWATPRMDARTSHRLHPRARMAGSANTRGIPGLDMERSEEILAVVPGTRVVRGSYRTGNSVSSFSSSGSMSPYDHEVNIYAELQTKSAATEVMRLYRDGLVHPSWDITDEGFSGEFGWFSWTRPLTARDGCGTAGWWWHRCTRAGSRCGYTCIPMMKTTVSDRCPGLPWDRVNPVLLNSRSSGQEEFSSSSGAQAAGLITVFPRAVQTAFCIPR